MDNLVHLHRHSEFSLLDGVGTAEHYASRAAELGQAALAITDHGSLAGTLYHVQACEEHGIKPILGMEAYFRQDITRDRAEKDNQNFFHLVLLAKNTEGWTNLMRLSSIAYEEQNFYQKPCINWVNLRKHSQGLIASTSCISGIVPRALLKDDQHEAERLLNIFRDIFGDDLYLEIQPHDFEEQALINLELINMANKFGMPVVATSDVHFPYKDWHDTQDILVRTKIGNDAELNVPETCWLASADEIAESFSDFHSSIPEDVVQQSIANSTEISNRIEHIVIDKSPKIPKATESLEEAESILREWCEEGLVRIGKTDDQVYLDRMEHEFDVLRGLKILDYFVIVGDMVRWAKSQNIRVGAGRGSAVGCLINYLIRITAIDPIGYDLLFERFMTKDTKEIPDIDIDFQDDRRDEVKDYLRKRWGDDYVVDIAAFQSFGMKAVIKDISRVIGVPYVKADRATKSIPDKLWGMDLDDLENQLPEVKNLFEEYPDLKKHAGRLQGQIKGLSKHAAAVIVCNRPAKDVIPMMQSKDGSRVTQWSERANAQLISPYGFLKIDCLSTDGLTVQAKAIELIKERHGIEIDFEDPKQFAMVESPKYGETEVATAFADGANLGVFQFGKSSGIKGFLKELRPTEIEHLIAANAMYRPGPMAFLGDYAARKNGAKWELIHESLDKYLSRTYGILVFQEQVMQIYGALAKDVDPSETAVFRKVVAKGIARDIEGKQKMEKYYEKFSEGCEEKGIPKSSYDKLWNQILEMSTYSFNRSHAAGYAVQAYQDKWLQAKYPLEFYSAFLTVDSDKPDKIPMILKETRLFGISVLPPDINISDIGFTIDQNNIRFGLLAIKNVADAAIKAINQCKPFITYKHFFETVPKNKVNKRVKKSLFKAGAFDSLGGRDNWLIDEEAEQIEGQATEREKALMELETLGFALSVKSDIDSYKKIIRERTIPSEELDSYDKQQVMLGGEIIKVKEYKTKKNELMAFVDISFEMDDYGLTFFPESYRRYQHLLAEGNAILVIGDWDKERQSAIIKNACTARQLAEDLKRS